MTPGHFEQDAESDTWGKPSQSPNRTLLANNNDASLVLSHSLKFKNENYKLITVTPATTPLPLMKNLGEEAVKITPAGGSKPVTVKTQKGMGKTKSMLPVPARNPAEKHKEDLRNDTQIRRRVNHRNRYQIS